MQTVVIAEMNADDVVKYSSTIDKVKVSST